MTTAILAVAAVTLIGLGVALRSRGPLLYVALWLFFGGLFAEDVLIVAYVFYGVGL